MEEEFLKYKSWKTGEEYEYKLNLSWAHERVTQLVCPFDKTPLLFCYDDMDKWTECVNCGEHYLLGSQQEIDEQARNNALERKRELDKLEKRKADLEARIKHAEEGGLLLSSEDYLSNTGDGDLEISP
jgi:hypothetical protein